MVCKFNLESFAEQTMAFFFFFLKNMANYFFFFIAAFFLFSSISIATEPEVGDESGFEYYEGSKRGPKEWGRLNPNWTACEEGDFQSPINIVQQDVQLLPQLGNLKRDYKPAPALVVNRGHDIMVRWKGDAGKIRINGSDYKLSQCHWHTPSEHTFNGKRHILEIHMVHINDRNEIAVVGILYKYGRPDLFLSRVFHEIKSAGKEEKEIGILNPGNIRFGTRKYYRYIGSLTVPPCSEAVIWTISKKVRTVSRAQVRALQNAIHDEWKQNARPTQSMEGRKVQFYIPHK